METFLVGVLVLTGISLLTGVRVLREYERGVAFRLDRARKSLAGPGLVMLLPFGIDRARIVDTRIQAIQIPPQEVITRDNISIVVSAVVYANVASPRHAILEVEEFLPATLQLAATTLRAVVGKLELDDILSNREGINSEVRNILDTRTEQWGVEITDRKEGKVRTRIWNPFLPASVASVYSVVKLRRVRRAHLIPRFRRILPPGSSKSGTKPRPVTSS
jgi:regulator of protease activity HflC (stomatin/prohibitin superfamily)